MSRVVINVSMFGKNLTGLGMFASSCLKALSSRRDVFGIGPLAEKYSIPLLKKSPRSIEIGSGKFASVLRALWINLTPIPKKDLLFVPTHHGRIFRRNQIVVVHDVICLVFPRQHPLQYLYFRFILPLILARCLVILAVSNKTKEDIVSYYGIDCNRIKVLYNTFSPPFLIAADTGPSTKLKEPKFLLAVGAKYPHKNIHEILEFSAVWKDDYILKIVSAGGAYKTQLTQLIKELQLERSVEICEYVSQEKLDLLYIDCSALVYPSKYEGFGIPSLEALSRRKPVIVSDIPVHREILEDAAIYVTLGDEQSWKNAFERLTAFEFDQHQYCNVAHLFEKYSQANFSMNLSDILTSAGFSPSKV